jgi:Zn-dependent protease
MPPIFKYGIIEDIDTVRRIRIGQFWGVDILITSLKWFGPIFFFSLHFLLNLFNRQLDLADRFYQSMIFAIAIEITTVFHAFGHILSGKMVNSAMNELLITTTRDVNLYHGDQSGISGKVHLVRSLGGPLFNLFMAGVCYALLSLFNQGFWFALFSSLISVNLFFGLGGLLPIPTVDGEVIWREVIRFIKKDK